MMNLFGLGVTSTESAKALVDGLLAKNPNPSPADLQAFLKLLSSEEREVALRLLVERGLSPNEVVTASAAVGAQQRSQWKTYATLAAAAGAGFHGYRRNNSIGWALMWFALGSLFPIVTTIVAAAQGYGQPRKA